MAILWIQRDGLTISNKRLATAGGSTINQIFSTCKQAWPFEAVFLPWVDLLNSKGSKIINKLRRQIIYRMGKVELGVYGRGWRSSKNTPLGIL